MEELLRDQVRQLREGRARQKRLENAMVQAYRHLPTPNYSDTIPGVGDVTAAVLTAFILDIDRFETVNKLVAYFGVLPFEVSSGVDRDGQPRGPRRYVMSNRGNDLVRRYLWMAALSAIRFNPAVRALYRAWSPGSRRARPWPSAMSCASCCIWCSRSGKVASHSTLIGTAATTRPPLQPR